MPNSKAHMTEEQHTLLMIRGAISTLVTEDQIKIKAAYDNLIELESVHGADNMQFAIGLRGAELAAEVRD